MGAGGCSPARAPRLTLLEMFVPAALLSLGGARGPVGRVLWPLQALLGSRSCQLWGPPGRASLRPPGLTLGLEHRVRCRVHGHDPECSQLGFPTVSVGQLKMCAPFTLAVTLPSACPGRKHMEQKSYFKRSAFVLSSRLPLRLTALAVPPPRQTHRHIGLKVPTRMGVECSGT